MAGGGGDRGERGGGERHRGRRRRRGGGAAPPAGAYDRGVRGGRVRARTGGAVFAVRCFRRDHPIGSSGRSRRRAVPLLPLRVRVGARGGAQLARRRPHRRDRPGRARRRQPAAARRLLQSPVLHEGPAEVRTWAQDCHHRAASISKPRPTHAPTRALPRTPYHLTHTHARTRTHAQTNLRAHPQPDPHVHPAREQT